MPGRGGAARRAAAARLAGRAPGRAAGVRHHLHPHRGRRPRDRGLPARAGPQRPALHRARRAGAAAGRRARPARRGAQGARGHQRPGHGLRQARPGLRGAPGRPAVAGRLLPADRPRRAGCAPGRGGPAARTGGPGHLGLLRLAGVPARAAGPDDARRAGRGGRAAVVRRAGDPGRPEPGPAGDDAQGPGRGRRGAQGQRGLGRHRAAVGVRRRALRHGGGGAAPGAAGHAQLPAHPGLPDGVPARAAGRPRRPSRAAGATTAPGARGPRRCRRKGPSWPGPGCSARVSTSARAGCGRRA